PPSLRPVVNRGAANGVHHGVDSRAGQNGPVDAVAHSGDFAIGLLDRVRPAANVVIDFIGPETMRVEPCTGFDSGDLQSGLAEGENRYAPSSAETDDGDIDRFQLDGHQRPPRAEAPRGFTGSPERMASRESASPRS